MWAIVGYVVQSGLVYTSRSMTLEDVFSSVMDLYGVTSVRSLMGLRIATMMPSFHVYAIL